MNDTINTTETPFDLDTLVAAGVVTDVTITEGKDGSDETVVHTIPAVIDQPVEPTLH